MLPEVNGERPFPAGAPRAWLSLPPWGIVQFNHRHFAGIMGEQFAAERDRPEVPPWLERRRPLRGGLIVEPFHLAGPKSEHVDERLDRQSDADNQQPRHDPP